MNGMEGFEYKVSVIVPVYNAEEYLRDCLDSLLMQTIDQKEMEVLLINDGSTDGSLEICREYGEIYDNIVIINKNNEGVSAARNIGIEKARGKYIMFLDADDELAKDTVGEICKYFDKVYDQVDMVTFPERKYLNGEEKEVHFRYKYLTKSGIYDLEKNRYITQSRINIAIKNDKSTYFDVNLHYAEDQDFLYRILEKKMKIGYIDKGLYKYKLRGDNTTEGFGYAYYMFESVITNYYEKLFYKYDKGVPSYLQAMFLYDINWKIRKAQLWPYHYDETNFKIAEERIRYILNKIRLDIIIEHPALDFYHKIYLLKLKNDNITLINDNKQLSLYDKEINIYYEKEILIVITQLKIYHNKIKILGHLKSPIFDFTDKPELIVQCNGEETIPELFRSAAGRYKSRMETNLFWGFYYEKKIVDSQKINFVVKINNILYNTKFYFMPYTPIDLKRSTTWFISKNNMVTFKNNAFYTNIISDKESYRQLHLRNEIIKGKNLQIYNMRESYINDIKNKTVWLYYDCKGVEKDNGYYQFKHDYYKNDGVERYYVSNNETLSDDLFTESEKANVIKFGDYKHKYLFLLADKIITAYIEKNNMYPFSEEELIYTKDLFNFQVIYLQHGILHASIPWKYTPESLQIDKVVASSSFEIRNFHEKYNFRNEDIYASGMPRFNIINKNEKTYNRILFAPSWRNYLITPQVNNYWKPQTDKFVNSDYYIIFNDFLNSPELHNLLEKYDMYLDFRLHPIFKSAYSNCFKVDSERVTINQDVIKNESYSIFITDFSSFVFDFAYLERPIIYFVPDYLQFKSGMNQYRELDFPFEEAFGKLVFKKEDVLSELKNIIENNCVIEDVYKKRIKNFFLPMSDNCEKLYRELMS